MSQRPTVDTATLKTRSIVYQNPDGTFPAIGGVLTMGDYTGHAAWTQDPYLNSVTLAGGVLTYDGADLLLNDIPVGGGVMNISGGTNISITGPVSTPTVNLNINEELDICGSAGMAGQVLTSQGVGAPPVWASGRILGRYWTSISGEITIDSTIFPLLAGVTGAVRMRVDIMGGGGGGGGGANGADGSGGGGGQGFNKTGIITHPIGAPVYISIGVGGAGGIGGTNIDPSTDGADGGPTFLKTSITGRTLMPIAGGGGGGRGPNPTNVGGDGFVSGENGSSGAASGGNGGGYYGGASEQNGGIGGNTASGTGCGGGGGGSYFGNPGGDGGTGDCGYCLIEILEVV